MASTSEASAAVTAHVVDPERVPAVPLAPPGSSSGLLDVFRRRYLLKLLVKKELQARYLGSFLGMLWSYVQPAVRFAMYFFVIGMVLGLRKNVDNFAIHIFSAMVFVQYFTHTFTSGTRSIVANKALVRKMSLPREMFPVSAMLVSAYHVIPQGLILLAGALASGWRPDVQGVLAGLLGFSIFAVFGMALALLFSAANVFFRDFGNVVSTLTTFTHWAVPMIYPFSKLHESSLGGTWVETIYLANPIATATLLVQRAFWAYSTSDPKVAIAENFPADLHLYSRGLVLLAASFAVLALSQWVFSRLEGKFAERL